MEKNQKKKSEKNQKNKKKNKNKKQKTKNHVHDGAAGVRLNRLGRQCRQWQQQFGRDGQGWGQRRRGPGEHEGGDLHRPLWQDGHACGYREQRARLGQPAGTICALRQMMAVLQHVREEIEISAAVYVGA